MKKVRSLAAGIAIMLALFILIYIATLYLKFNPDETKIEKGLSKLYQFFNSSQTAKDYIRIAVFLCLSAAVTLVFKKTPEWSVLVSFSLLGYVLTVYDNGSLAKRPSVITILCLCHAAGSLISCAYADRFDDKKHCVKASLLSSSAALGLCGITMYYQNILLSMAEQTEKMTEAGVVFSNKVSFSRELMTIIYNRFETAGAEAARETVADLSQDITIPVLKNFLLTSINKDQFPYYATLAIIIVFCAVFALFLLKYSRLASVLLSVIPLGYTLKCFLTDRISTLTLPLMVMTLLIFVTALSGYDQAGKGHDPVYDDEEEDSSADNTAPEQDPDEVYYS